MDRASIWSRRRAAVGSREGDGQAVRGETVDHAQLHEEGITRLRPDHTGQRHRFLIALFTAPPQPCDQAVLRALAVGLVDGQLVRSAAPFVPSIADSVRPRREHCSAVHGHRLVLRESPNQRPVAVPETSQSRADLGHDRPVGTGADCKLLSGRKHQSPQRARRPYAVHASAASCRTVMIHCRSMG